MDPLREFGKVLLVIGIALVGVGAIAVIWRQDFHSGLDVYPVISSYKAATAAFIFPS